MIMLLFFKKQKKLRNHDFIIEKSNGIEILLHAKAQNKILPQ